MGQKNNIKWVTGDPWAETAKNADGRAVLKVPLPPLLPTWPQVIPKTSKDGPNGRGKPQEMPQTLSTYARAVKTLARHDTSAK